ncbi:MAG: hypothetical protein A2527_05370 [Candidatus Lambdaproteobacteria bacterium RIFOXYD2_FULL_50_16]|uniref:histidine kinase n=1 Tax=Candidatus Lambdaproteobacteria bacterium RIFOXYD2_FULL_50_16 TaxID=1817772 RepID=A0A1F6G918_9PROT|nr:MAG: hypothetical protein A2527_05370 [Candidatus Lambdaproteobacteria bacterium RIFOXYD2_FULL_50_16]
MMRKILSRELQDAGYETCEAVDGLDALEKIPQLRPNLVTLDVDMPRLNGFEACFRLRSDFGPENDYFKNLPVVFITANDTIEGRSRGFEVGASDFITKPFIKGEVVESVNRLLNLKQGLSGLKVVVAEDTNMARQLIDNILRAEGVQTYLVSNGVEAFDLIKRKEHEIDLLLTDYFMPQMNGDELCKKIRNELGNKSLPIIFLSAMSERGEILRIFKAGASDYVIKPFAKEELLSRIRVHLEARQLTKDLENKVHQLKKLNKLKDEFLAVTSHDLRAPLNGIMGFSQLLLSEEGLTEIQREYLGHVQQSGEFLLSLIGEILYLGRVNSENNVLDFKPVEVSDIIKSATETLRHMASPKGLELIIENRCEQSGISGDRGGLMRVFNNLLSNAIKFTPKGGKIRQIIEPVGDDKIKVSVIDSGIGIPKDKIQFLFDKYSQASRPGTAGEASTGLGMSITKELVEQHGGEILVQSEEGKGSQFSVILPKLYSAPVLEPVVAPAIDSSSVFAIKPAKKLHCLLVDDNQLNTKLGLTMLKKQGYSVDTAADGQEAVMKYIDYRMQKRTLDLILMDVRMPVMDGLEATRRIRQFEEQKKVARVAICAMTAGTSEGEKQECLSVGMDNFVTKPINLAQIQEATQGL